LVQRYVLKDFDLLSDEELRTFRFPERRFMSVSFTDGPFTSSPANCAFERKIDHAAISAALLVSITLAVLLRAGWEAGTIGALIEEHLKRIESKNKT